MNYITVILKLITVHSSGAPIFSPLSMYGKGDNDSREIIDTARSFTKARSFVFAHNLASLCEKNSPKGIVAKNKTRRLEAVRFVPLFTDKSVQRSTDGEF